VTFDCFGTLIDWNTGFRSVLAPMAGEKTDELLTAYHRQEAYAEKEKPFRPYKEVLATALDRAARDVGLDGLTGNPLAESWGTLAPFEDVEPMLQALRSAGYAIGVLTNCDDDLFSLAQRTFSRPFDAVVTAEQMHDYKPSLVHFNFFRETIKPEQWIHVACSWYHDIAPAAEVGIPRIWLDRDVTGHDPARATTHVRSAHEVPSAIARVF